MIWVQHRVVTRSELKEVPSTFGVEIDVRSHPDGWLYLAHDPFEIGERLENFLQEFRHELLIVNVKEDGLEAKCATVLQSFGIRDFFFLDQSIPAIVRGDRDYARHSSGRLSEFEPTEALASLSPFIGWAWVDSFSPSSGWQRRAQFAKERGLKVCVASPELHGKEKREHIATYKREIHEIPHYVDAVCTKFPGDWQT